MEHEFVKYYLYNSTIFVSYRKCTIFVNMFKSFKFELNPNSTQRPILTNHFGCIRFVYNWGLNEKSKAFKESGKNISCFSLNKRVTQLKKEQETKWLRDVHSQPLQIALRNLDNAYTNFFNKRARFPRFKSKKSHQSFQYPQGVKVKDNLVFLPKIGWIHFFKSRDIIGYIKTATISITPTGRYFISITCDTGLIKPGNHVKKKETAVGVDLGIKDFAITSDNQVFENQRYLIKSLKKLRLEQRSLTRKVKGSNRRERQRIKVAKIHEKVSNLRKDYLHKVSTALVKEYDTICIEDLNVSGMIKNRKLSKHIQDVGWRTFRTFLEYKCEWNGKNLIVIGRFDPSSKMCNHCGHINKYLKLSERKWTCSACQRTVQRDFNAAKNIKDFGLGTRPIVSQRKALA